jgi:oxygen-independent coproporphyrinogen III oxidase
MKTSDSSSNVCFDADLIRRYDGRGPRYTSYPTALQFNEQLSETEYRDNAKASNETGAPLSLYVHIPFCHSLCYYCGCNKIVTRNEERVAKYLQNLYREIDMQAELFDRSRKVEQLHFGGGTPTYLDEAQLRDLMGKLGEAFSFDTSAERQFSIEVDPRTVDADGIRLLTELGFNRLSLGIQDFNPEVQQAVNRIQSIEQTQALVDAAHESGFKSISFDLIYGLPLQTVESFDKTLDIVIGMRPDRFAVYNYAHLPPGAGNQAGDPREDDRAPDCGGLRLHRHGPLRAAGRRARSCARGRHAPAQFPGLFDAPLLRPRQPGRQLHQQYRQHVCAELGHDDGVRGHARGRAAADQEGTPRR